MSWRDAFFDPKKGPGLYVAGAYVLGISINLVSSYVADWAKTRGWLEWLFLIGGPVAIVAVSSSLIRRRLEGDVITTGTLKWKPQRSRGLVVIASHGEGIATARKAIEYHLPHRLWVIHSDLSKSDFEKDLRDWAVDNRYLSATQISPIPLSNEQFEDPGTVQSEIDRRVYGDLPEPWREEDVIIDITGGRKQTTAGAFLAALPPGRRLEVNIPESVDPQNVRGKTPGDPVEIEISRRLKKVGRR